jgi:hypothetical protein
MQLTPTNYDDSIHEVHCAGLFVQVKQLLSHALQTPETLPAPAIK